MLGMGECLQLSPPNTYSSCTAIIRLVLMVCEHSEEEIP
jgi:hypothetical protein